MKNKEAKKTILQQDLVKYCEQIGITNVPTLVFTPQEFDTWTGSKRRTKRDRYLGYCSYTEPVILVNLEFQKPVVHRKEWLYNGKRYRWKESKWNLSEARHTLVHELVHYRWQSMWHGYKFEKRIIEIVKGKRFEPPTPKEEKTPSRSPTTIEINPRSYPWIESYFSVYR